MYDDDAVRDSMENAVANGAAVLDEFDPYWREIIQPDYFNMVDWDSCAWGQVMEYHERYDIRPEDDGIDSASHGFDLPHRARSNYIESGKQASLEADYFEMLEQVWREEIE